MSIYVLSYMSNKLMTLTPLSKPHTDNTGMVIAIMAMIFSIWSTYIYYLADVLDPLISSILGTEGGGSEFMTKLDALHQVDVDITYLIRLGLSMYGLDAILGLLALACSLYLLMLHIKREIRIPRFLLISIVCFIVLLMLSVIIFFTIKEFSAARLYVIARIFSLLIISGSMVTAYRKLQTIRNLKKVTFSLLTCIIVIMLIVLSTFTLYQSPITKIPNPQVSEGDYYSMVTLFEKRDDSVEILEYGISQMRFYDAIYGYSYPKVNIGFEQAYGGTRRPIDHFGYNASFNLGANYDGKRYFLLETLGKEYYKNIYPEFPDTWRFTDLDYKKLESDTSVIRISSNTNLVIYLINDHSDA